DPAGLARGPRRRRSGGGARPGLRGRVGRPGIAARGALADVRARVQEARLMFTGLVEGVGRLEAREARGGDARLRIAAGTLPFDDVAPGESIAVNGVCLTVVAFDDAHFEADASNETLSLTTLGALAPGRALNLRSEERRVGRAGGSGRA